MSVSPGGLAPFTITSCSAADVTCCKRTVLRCVEHGLKLSNARSNRQFSTILTMQNRSIAGFIVHKFSHAIMTSYCAHLQSSQSSTGASPSLNRASFVSPTSSTVHNGGVSRPPPPRPLPPQARPGDQIRAIPGNDMCADCRARSPQWCSINLSVTLCIDCAAIHRFVLRACRYRCIARIINVSYAAHSASM